MKISKLASLALTGAFILAFANLANAQSTTIEKAPETELNAGPIGDGPGDADPPPLLSEEETALPELSVYPNPGNGIVNVDLPKGTPTEVQVYDAWGNLHFKTKVNLNANQKFKLDLSNSKAGVYLISVNGQTLRYHKW